MRKHITTIVDVFYPPFRRMMPIQTFRYAVCGGSNTVLGLTIYFYCFHFLFNRQNVYTALMVFKPHNAALFISFCFTFLVGFLLNKYIVFVDSDLKGRIQLFRYFLSFSFNLIINYFLLKLFIEALHIEAFAAQLITTFIIIIFSYLSQKHFSFRKRKLVD
ncbi:MAG: GtrA family protein [Ferruginibacter sp.]